MIPIIEKPGVPMPSLWRSSGVLLVLSLFGTPASAFEPVDGTILLGRPTDTSVTLSVVPDVGIVAPDVEAEVFFEYGDDETALLQATETYYLEANPVVTVLSELTPSTRYYYRMAYRTPDVDENGSWRYTPTYMFYTQRKRGETFVFTIEADSHLGKYIEASDDALYLHTMERIRDEGPDFHFDLGDTFLMNRIDGVTAGDLDAAYGQYLKHRPFHGVVGHSSPVFLVVGNHENEEGWNLDDTENVEDSLPLLSQNARKRYYLNPVGDGFYSGGFEAMAGIGGDHLRDSYYAFEWGDALFVVLDPFFNTMTQPYRQAGVGQEENDEAIGTPWSWTLGEKQYLWLKNLLSHSTSTYKFVFAHHMTGGSDNGGITGSVAGYGRGGAPFAHLFEWGGENSDGTWGFAEQRPGWRTPIHQLLVENGVDVFFHGHDHLYAKEALDGVVYQECPRPDAKEGDEFGLGQDYDLQSDDTLPNSGFVRVTVGPEETEVAYVQTKREGAFSAGEVVHRYVIEASPSRHAPLVDDLRVEAEEDREVSFKLNGTDTDGDALIYEILNGPHHGELAMEGDIGRYTPAEDFNGEDTVVYRANDGEMRGNIGYVIIDVAPVDDAPDVADLEISTEEETAVPFSLPSRDVDGEPIMYTLKQGPSHGVVFGGLTDARYTPSKDFNGVDEMIVSASDGRSDAQLSIFVTVLPKNDPPVVMGMTVTTDEETPVVVAPRVVDIDGDEVEVVVIEPPLHGSLSTEGETLIYAPEVDFYGEDHFWLAGNDGVDIGPSTEVVVRVGDVDDEPVAFGQTLTTDEDTPLHLHLVGEDPDDGGIAFVLVRYPENGELVGEGAAWVYVPEEDFSGTDSFGFKVESDGVSSNIATVSIVITPVPDPPVPENIIARTTESAAVEVRLIASDSDSDTLLFEITRAPERGTATLEGSLLTYTPVNGFIGADTLAYRVSDDTGNSAAGLVRIIVEETPSMSDAGPDAADAVDAGAVVDTDAAAHDTDDTADDTPLESDDNSTADEEKCDLSGTDGTGETGAAVDTRDRIGASVRTECGCDTVGERTRGRMFRFLYLMFSL